MNGFIETLERLFTRDLQASTLEVIIFLLIIFGFFGLLVLLSRVQRRKEEEQIRRALEEKWERLCSKYGISDEERAFLEELARYLERPDKKYLLLAHGDVFHNALREYSAERRPDAELVKSIVNKTGIVERPGLLSPLPLQRRKHKRKKVRVTVKIAPIEEESPPKSATMLDISRGGCMTTNPDLFFQPGDDLRLSFTIQGKRYQGISGEVVRSSAGNRRLHIAFGHLKRSGGKESQ
jgi:hypothetical protein